MVTNVRSILGPGGQIAQAMPGYEHRESQLVLAEAIEAVRADGGHLVAEAGTGTGKSLAYLVPAAVSGKRVIVSTENKALQDQLALIDVPFLQRTVDPALSVAVVKGRSNYVCLKRVDDEREAVKAAGAERTGWTDFERWALASNGDFDGAPEELLEFREAFTVDSAECFGKNCPMYAACYAEVAKRQAWDARVVITNHAMLMQDIAIRARTEGAGSVLPDTRFLVIDEAHALENVAQNAFGVELREGRWPGLARRYQHVIEDRRLLIANRQLQDQATGYWETVQAVGMRWRMLFDALLRRFDENEPRVLLTDEPDHAATLIGLLRQVVEWPCPDWLTETKDQLEWGVLIRATTSLTERLSQLMSTETDRAGYVRFASLVIRDNQKRVTLTALPLNVSTILRDALWHAPLTRKTEEQTTEPEPPAIVAVSATLTTSGTFGYWRGKVGMTGPAQELVVPSPFDFERNVVVYVPAGPLAATLTPPAWKPGMQGQEEREKYLTALAGEVQRLVDLADGGVFVLFTSFAALNFVHDRVAPSLVRPVYRQQAGTSAARLLAEFRAAGNGVLFGTKTFWSGQDVVGDALSMVIIDKLPFPSPSDPLWKARIDAMAAKDEPWFTSEYVPHAQIQLKQGAGRLIRTREDRGVIALLDGRVALKNYGNQMMMALPPGRVTHDIADVARMFGVF